MIEKKVKIAIEACLTTALGEALNIERITPLSGGDIHQAFQLHCGQFNFFVKLNRADKLEMFEAEVLGLNAIAKTQTIRVPEVMGCGQGSDKAFLILEFININHAGEMKVFANALANLHRQSSASFGFNQDNYIGATPQLNQWTDNWLEFLAEQRFGFQLKRLARNGAGRDLLKLGERLINNLDTFFHGYCVTPALLHGDLWQGNYGFNDEGEPVIYDPACYFGDHEADLAMMELFGHPGEAFFTAYHQHFPIHSGYPIRKRLYNLYHIMNHANLFGGGYASQAHAMMVSLLDG